MISKTADLAPTAYVPSTAQIWDYVQIRDRAVVGARVIVGRGAYIGMGVTIGDDSKVQNYAQIFEPSALGAGVFIGPGAILTNDRYPRAVTPDMRQKRSQDWDQVGVQVLDGASIGAGAICIAPMTVGRWAMIAAGAVVTTDVPDFALIAGSPGRQIGWVGRTGKRLVGHVKVKDRWLCVDTGETYHLTGSGMQITQETSE